MTSNDKISFILSIIVAVLIAIPVILYIGLIGKGLSFTGSMIILLLSFATYIPMLILFLLGTIKNKSRKDLKIKSQILTISSLKHKRIEKLLNTITSV